VNDIYVLCFAFPFNAHISAFVCLVALLSQSKQGEKRTELLQQLRGPPKEASDIGSNAKAAAAAAAGVARGRGAQPAAVAAANGAADRPGPSKQQQQQQQTGNVAVSNAQRQSVQRKAAAGVSLATRAVMGNSQELSAAAEEARAVAAAQRAALPVGFEAPATTVQQQMVQQLTAGAVVSGGAA
jgi:hypothetical protein